MTLDEFLSCKLLVQAIRGGGTIKYKKYNINTCMLLVGLLLLTTYYYENLIFVQYLKIIKYGGGVIIIIFIMLSNKLK